MQKTWQEMEKSGNYGIPALDDARLEPKPPAENYRKNVGEWVLALHNAKAQSQHQDIRYVCLHNCHI